MPIFSWLKEMKQLQARNKWLAVGPVYLGAALLVMAVVLLLFIASITNSSREVPAIPPQHDEATRPTPDLRQAAAVLPTAVAKTKKLPAAQESPIDDSEPHMPVTGRVILSFGWQLQPVLNDWRFHPGVDMSAAESSPVQAIYGGEVAGIYTDGNYGLTVVIKSSAETVYYGSLAMTKLVRGGNAAAGSIIGTVGTSPAEPYSHLHLVIRNSSGKYIDPQEVLKGTE